MPDEAAVLPERVRMRSADRRAAVLDEAIRVVGEQGFRGFSINDLARRCGLTTAGLLHHFASKEGLLVALLEERDRRDREVLTDRIGGLRDQPLTREALLAVLRTIVGRNAAQPDLTRLYVTLKAESLTGDHPARAYLDNREAETRRRFAQIIAPHVADPPSTAFQLQAALHGLQVEWLRRDCGFDLVRAWDRMADKLIR